MLSGVMIWVALDFVLDKLHFDSKYFSHQDLGHFIHSI